MDRKWLVNFFRILDEGGSTSPIVKYASGMSYDPVSSHQFLFLQVDFCLPLLSQFMVVDD